ncbi:MAG: RNA methyltransferase [Anaerolineaceae bacterium]|nr:RNA methyltransferase [Anaerolineaceae bacterium]
MNNSPESNRKTNQHQPRKVIGLLDNIRSILNVGSIFRTADGAGFEKLILSGITATPLHPKLAKTGLGAEGLIPWEYTPNALDTASELIHQGYSLWALEECDNAVSLFDYDRTIFPDSPVALVVGNEITGVDPDILNLAHVKVWIPMNGSKRSLNVAVAFGIAAYNLSLK